MVCWDFHYVLCDCGKIYYEGKGETLCGDSGFEGEDDGQKCYTCEDKFYGYLLLRNFLQECPSCSTEVKVEGKMVFKQVDRDTIVKFNGGIIPPATQTLDLFEKSFGGVIRGLGIHD